jgi:hypothetical protein
MLNLRLARKISIILSFVFTGCVWGESDTGQLRVVSLLADQFETVFHAEPGLLASAHGWGQLSPRSANSLRVPFADLIWSLDPFGKESLGDLFGNADAVLVGARNFQPPSGLGGARSQLCYVVILRNANTFDLSHVMSKSALASSTANGVWKWSMKPTEGQQGDQLFFATQIGHAYVVISNGDASLQVISAGLIAANEAVPIAPGLQAWESLHEHDFWGYRQCLPSETANGGEEAIPGCISTTKSLYFFADAARQVGVLRLIAPDDTAAQTINAKGKLPLLKQDKSGVWESSFLLPGNETSSEQVFDTLALFGFAVYL